VIAGGVRSNVTADVSVVADTAAPELPVKSENATENATAPSGSPAKWDA
jgi:hypothetical protein